MEVINLKDVKVIRYMKLWTQPIFWQDLRDYSENLFTNLSVKINESRAKEESLKKNIDNDMGENFSNTDIVMEEIKGKYIVLKTKTELKNVQDGIKGKLAETITDVKTIKKETDYTCLNQNIVNSTMRSKK